MIAYMISSKRGDGVTIYIDSLFLTNLFMDSVIIFIVGIMRRRQPTVLKLFFGAALSALYGALMFFPRLSFLYSAGLKIAFSIVPVLIVFGAKGVRDFLASWALFWFITVACGGIIFAISTMTDFGSVLQTMTSNCIMYVRLNPLILILGCILLYLLSESYRRICIKNFSREKLLLDLELEYLGHSFLFTGLIDTGCELTEPLSGAPVIVAEKQSFAGIPPSLSRISVNTAAGSRELELILPTRIVCKQKNIKIADDTVVALTENSLSSNGLYNAVINPDAVENIVFDSNIENMARC